MLSGLLFEMSWYDRLVVVTLVVVAVAVGACYFPAGRRVQLVEVLRHEWSGFA